MASMTPELRKIMRTRPWIERLRLWRLLRRLSSLDRQFEHTFAGDAGYALSNVITGGRGQRIALKIRDTEDRIRKITEPLLHGDKQ